MSQVVKTGEFVSGRFFSSVKYKANLRNIYFDLSIGFLDELISDQNHKCYYSGLPIDAKTRNKITASLDRTDSSKGYTEDNVRFVHSGVNFMKWTHDEDVFLDLVEKIYKNKILGI